MLSSHREQEQLIQAFFIERKRRIQPFCRKYHGWRGAFKIHGESLKDDLVLGVINTLWAVPFLTLKTSLGWIQKLGWEAPDRWMGLLPARLKTSGQRKLEWLVATEVLELPITQGVLNSSVDALSEKMQRLAQGSPENWFQIWKKVSREELASYTALRSSASELASTGATLMIAWYWFGNASITAFQMGDRIARTVAHRNAAKSFFLGEGVGSAFYGVFPQNPTQAQVYIATAMVLLGLSVFSILIQAVLDPLHDGLGLHERRLARLCDQMELRLLQELRVQLAEKLLREPARDGLVTSLHR